MTIVCGYCGGRAVVDETDLVLRCLQCSRAITCQVRPPKVKKKRVRTPPADRFPDEEQEEEQQEEEDPTQPIPRKQFQPTSPRDGCDLWKSCFTCPLPRCRYDMEPREAAKMAKAFLIVELLRQGKSPQQIGDMKLPGMSRRTVYRLAKAATRLL